MEQISSGFLSHSLIVRNVGGFRYLLLYNPLQQTSVYMQWDFFVVFVFLRTASLSYIS